MNATDTPVLTARLGELADALGAKKPTPEGIRVWFQVLKEFPFEYVVDTLDGWAKRHPKMPAPADVWKFLNESRTMRIERQAEADKKRFASEMDRGFKRNPVLAKRLKDLAVSMRHPVPVNPQDWARRIWDAYVEGRPLRDSDGNEINGQPINFAQIQCAAQALRRTVADAMTAKTLRETMP